MAKGRGQDRPNFPGLPEDSPFRDFFERFFGEEPRMTPRRPSQSLGSGFIISSDGYILTNAHVVANGGRIVVRLNDHREKNARIIGKDELSDVALLKIDARDLPTVNIGDSDELEVGEWVLAIGSPFGLEHTATQGIVSALGRSLPGDTYVPFIQTDVALNPGNSGGPLFNTDGEVVGVNAQIFSETGGYMGVSFAVPINVAMDVVEQLKTKGEVTRGWLGVLIQPVTKDLAESFGLARPRGALVAKVTPDSPASRGGLRPGDIILEFDGQEVDQSSELPPIVGNTPVGEEVPIEILRSGNRQRLEVTIAQLEVAGQPARIQQRPKKTRLNMAVTDLSEAQRKALDLDKGGVLVEEVGPGPAAEAGLNPGDVIVELNQQPVRNAAHFNRLINELPSGKPVPVLVRREEGALFLALRVPKRD